MPDPATSTERFPFLLYLHGLQRGTSFDSLNIYIYIYLTYICYLFIATRHLVCASQGPSPVFKKKKKNEKQKQDPISSNTQTYRIIQISDT